MLSVQSGDCVRLAAACDCINKHEFAFCSIRMPWDFITADLLLNAIYCSSNSPPLALHACSSCCRRLFLFAFSFQPAHHHTRVSKSAHARIHHKSNRQSKKYMQRLKAPLGLLLDSAADSFPQIFPAGADGGG
jgi:hypothetical protein